jgi:hypothetical protein
LTPIPATAAERGPVAIVQNDFNADGNQDLAIVNQATNNVTILLGKGDGTFAEATGSPISSGIGNGPVAVAAGDLNGDAKPDLAVVNQTDNSVSVLLNNGDATFTASASSPLQTGAGTLPNGVAIADFNQDGFADIAVTNSGANSFSVFVGISGGLFTQAFQPPAGPTGSTPTAIVAGTFATGGFPDVAASFPACRTPPTGKSAATGTASSRINDNRHWLSDVAAGAVVGITSAKFASGRWRVFGIRAPSFIVGPTGGMGLGYHTSF